MKIAATLIIVSALIGLIAFGYIQNIRDIEASWFQSLVAFGAVGVAALTFIVSSIGTASTILLGWRMDRRQAHEAALKIEQLELQVRELRLKLDASKTEETVSEKST